jgi:predicted outer membrane repeat protein
MGKTSRPFGASLSFRTIRFPIDWNGSRVMATKTYRLRSFEHLEERRLLAYNESAFAIPSESIVQPLFCSAMVGMPLESALTSSMILPQHADQVFASTEDSWERDFASGETEESGVVTVSLVNDDTLVNGGSDSLSQRSNLFSTLDRLFGNTESWLSRIREAVETWDKLIGLRFVFVTDDGAAVPDSKGVSGLRGQIRFAGLPLRSSENVLGYATSKNGEDFGDIVINTNISDSDSFLPNLSAIVLHEFGHVLGLKHTWPTNQTKIMEERLVRDVRGPQSDDIWEVQKIHGDNNEPNDSLANSTNLGRLPIGTTTIRDLSIRDNQDIDTIRFLGGSDKKISVRLIPEGGVYKKAYEESPSNVYPEFNSLEQSNLRFELLDQSGQLLAVRDLRSKGETETLENFSLDADGEYYLRVRGFGIDTQRYSMVISIDYATVADDLPEGDMEWLRQRIEQANEETDPQPIEVPAGIYRFETPIRIRGQVALHGAGIDRTIFDGGEISQLFVADGGISLSIAKATLRNGWTDRNGGAVYFYRTNLTLDTVSLVNNRAANGGGVYVFDADAMLIEVAASFNEAQVLGGAAYFLDADARVDRSNFSYNRALSGGAIASLGDIQIDRSYFTANQASGGGAIAFGANASNRFELKNSWVIGNRGDYGGGLALGVGVSTLSQVHVSENIADSSAGGIRITTDNSASASGGRAVVTIDRSLIDKNQSGSAGGIHSNANSDVTITRSWIRQNQGVNTTGGIGTSGNVRLEETTVSENRAKNWFGGGVGVSEDGSLLAINSTFSSNIADSYGSGLATFAGGTIDLLNSTVVDNSLDTNIGHGAGIHVQTKGRATLTNTIVANNRNGVGKVDVVGSVSISTSLIGAIDTSTAQISSGSSELIGDVTAPIDPLLGPLADNGGPTPTHRLFANSPALNVGISVQGLRDQRGILRQDGRVDLGAFEDATIPNFTNHTPTLEIASATPIRISGGTTGVVLLRNVGDGDGNRQSVAVRATSSNGAVIPTVQVSPIQSDGTAQLEYSIAPGTSGFSTIRIEVTDAGADSKIGTSDDLSKAVSFDIHVNGPQSGLPLLSISDAVLLEPRAGDEVMSYKLHLSRPSTEPVSVRVKSVAMVGAPHATEGADYTGNEQQVTFLPGETERIFEIRVNADKEFEETEIVTLRLDQNVGAILLRSEASGLIIDTPSTFGNPLLPPIRPQPTVSTGIYTSVRVGGPTVVPPSPVIRPPKPPVQRLLADTYRFGDINRDGSLSHLDVLTVINYINRYGSTRGSLDTTWKLDVDEDQFVGPFDVLLLINTINEKLLNTNVVGEGSR